MASFSCGNSSTSKAIRKGGKAIIHGNMVGSYCAGLSSFLLSSPASTTSEKKYVAQLLQALFEGNIKLLEKILKKNVDVNLFLRFVEDGEKMTALHFTALKGKVEVLDTLLQSKMCKVDLKTPFDESTALHFACRHPDNRVSKKLVESLLLWGADINIGDHWEKSPLIWATEMGHGEVVQVLLNSGASINHCYQIADMPETLDRCHSPLSQLLLRDPFYGNNSLIQACRFYQVDILHKLLSYGPEINAQNLNGSTALHAVCGGYAAENGNGLASSVPDPHIVGLLVENGAHVNCKDNLGMTPIIRAVLSLEKLIKFGSSDYNCRVLEILDVIRIIQLLIREGCDISSAFPCLVPKREITVLKKLLLLADHVWEFGGCSFQRLVEMLVLAGCCVDSEDIELAAHLKQAQLLGYLLDYYRTPLTLKCCCILQLRLQTKLPLQQNLQVLNIPEVIKKMVCLEI